MAPRRSVPILALAAVAVSWAVPVSAQESTCFIEPPTTDVTRTAEFGQTLTRMTTPNIRCDDGRRIRADQSITYESSGLTVFTGNFFFQDDQQTLTSFSANYDERSGRLTASGNVRLIDRETGNQIEGANLDYLRAGFLGREEEEIRVVGGRPRAQLVPAGNESAAPYDVRGDEIEIRGSDWFRAVGSVEVIRDSLTARADSLQYAQAEGTLYLDGSAVVELDSLDLRANEIVMLLPGDTLRDLVARGDGRLVGERIDLTAPFIRLELLDGALQGLWAAPLYRTGDEELAPPLRTVAASAEPDSAFFARPVALAEGMRMTGDSLDVRAPGERLERVVAIGNARAVSLQGDSLNTEATPELIREDWIQGDTVVAVFGLGEAPAEVTAAVPGAGDSAVVPAAVTDAAANDATPRRESVLERLEARGNASSIYRLPVDSTRAEGRLPDGPVPPDSTVVLGVGGNPDDPEAGITSTDTVAGPDSLAAAEAPADSAAATEAAATPMQAYPFAVHYVRAAEIVIVMTEGQVDRMLVTGLQFGTYLEPVWTGGTPPGGVAGSGGPDENMGTPPGGGDAGGVR